MKIIYVVNAFNRGGAEIGLLTLLRSRMFSDIDLELIAICRGSGEIGSDIQSTGVPYRIMYKSEAMAPWMLAAALVRLVIRFIRDKPDAVILSLPQANIIGRVAATLARVKNIISFEHNTHLAKPIYETLFRATSGMVSLMLADSVETGRVAANRLYRKQPPRTLVVPLVSFSEGGAATRPGMPRIVSAGRLTATKNHQDIIRAIAILRHRGNDIQLDILGDGPLRNELEDLSRQLEVNDLVSFPGFVTDWPHHAPYTAFVLSSHHEGLCIVALEAMHSGIPVISPVVGGMKDYLSDQNALILKEINAESIAEAIMRVVSDQQIAARLIDNAQATVRSRYGVEATQVAFRKVNKVLLSLEGK